MASFVRWVPALLVVLLPARAAFGTEWYVSQSAAAGGDGTSARPFQSINDVMGGIQTGDTVWVADGVYHETLNFYHLPGAYDEAHRTTISAAPGATSVVIDGDGTSNEYIVQAATPYLTFRGLVVRNGSTEAFQFYGCRPGSCAAAEVPADWGEIIDCKTEAVGTGVVFYFAGHGTVTNSDIFGGVAGKGSDGTVLIGNRIHGSQVEGVALHDDSKHCKYLNNTIYDNQRPNIYLDSASFMTVDANLIYMSGDPPVDNAGIQLADENYPELTGPVTANITITNNVIFNTYDGIYFWDSGVWAGQSGLKNVTIANNTIVNSKNRGLYWDPGAHQNTVIRNNIVAGAAGVGSLLVRARSTTGITLDHNLWYLPSISQAFDWGGTLGDHAAWAAASGQGTGDVLADPGFVAAWALPASNFMLAQNSAAVDQGVADVPIPTGDHTLDHDFRLASRPAGQGYDLGAFEYGAAEPPPDAGNPALGSGGAGGNGGGTAGAGPAGGSGSSESCSCRTASSRTGDARLLGWLGLALAIGRRVKRQPLARPGSLWRNRAG